jgi:hypothetical protein
MVVVAQLLNSTITTTQFQPWHSRSALISLKNLAQMPLIVLFLVHKAPHPRASPVTFQADCQGGADIQSRAMTVGSTFHLPC